jgi:hypothetical protein
VVDEGAVTIPGAPACGRRARARRHGVADSRGGCERRSRRGALVRGVRRSASTRGRADHAGRAPRRGLGRRAHVDRSRVRDRRCGAPRRRSLDWKAGDANRVALRGRRVRARPSPRTCDCGARSFELDGARSFVTARPPRRAASPASPWRGRAGIEGLELPSVGAPLFGVSLGVTRDFGRLLHAGGEASAWDGVAKRTTGTVGIRMVAIEPMIGLEVGPLDIDLGARIAWVSLAGTSAASGFHGAAISGFIGGAEIRAGTRIVGPLRWWVRGGWLVQGERGIVSGDDDVTVGGGYVALGLGVRLPR